MTDIAFAIAAGPRDRDLAPLLKDLEAVRRHHTELSFELLLITDGWLPSQAEQAQLNGAWRGQRTQLANPVKRGWIAGRNRLATASGATLIVFLDADLSELRLDAAALVATFAAQPWLVGVRGQLRASEGKGAPKGWDLGAASYCSAIDLEGLSAWRRERFLALGGFRLPKSQTVTAHEGLNLSWTAALEHGPRSLQYFAGLNARHPVRRSVGSERRLSVGLLDGPPAISTREAAAFFEKVALLVGEVAPAQPSKRKYSYSALLTANRTGEFLDSFILNFNSQSVKPDRLVFVLDEPGAGPSAIEAQLRESITDCEIDFAVSSPGGRSASLNQALAMVKTDYFMLWDIDDWYFPYRVEETIRFAEAEAAQRRVIDFASWGIIRDNGTTSHWPVTGSANRLEFLQALVAGRVPCPFPTALVRTKAVKVRFNEKISTAEDLTFYCQNLPHWKHVFVSPEPLLLYRPAPNSLSRQHPIQTKVNTGRVLNEFRRAVRKAGVDKFFKHPLDASELRVAELFRFDGSGDLDQPSVEIEELYGSLSWRITKPLRTLGEYAPQLMRWLRRGR